MGTKLTNVFPVYSGDEGASSASLLLCAPFNTESLHNVSTWLQHEETRRKSDKSSAPFLQFVAQYQKENCSISDTGIQKL